MVHSTLRALRGLLPTVALVLGMTAAAQDLNSVEIRTLDLGSGIAMLVGQGGNIGLSVGPDGSFLIDDQFAPLGPKIRAAVEAFGGGPVRFVLNTHFHGDHAGGNEPLGKAGAVIVAHDNVRERLRTPQHNALRGTTTPASPAGALPVMTYSDGATLHLNGHTIRAFHTPHAHTDGDSIVFIEDANVLHLGDSYFAGMYPYIDLSSGGSIDGMIAAAERALALADGQTRIIPGHGPLSNRAELSAYRDMLVGIRDAVWRHVQAGLSLSETVAARPSRKFDSVWAKGFMKPEGIVTLVYKSLSKASG